MTAYYFSSTLSLQEISNVVSMVLPEFSWSFHESEFLGSYLLGRAEEGVIKIIPDSLQTDQMFELEIDSARSDELAQTLRANLKVESWEQQSS